MSNQSIQKVSDTAFWVASYRAAETKRTDALFHDPLASELSGTRGDEMAAQMAFSPYPAWSVVIRTRVIDDIIKDLLRQGYDAIVNLGAGLDTRPYRLDLPASLPWIEADFAEVIDYKVTRLATATPCCALERVRIDLSDRAARRGFFAEIAGRFRKVAILTEGVVPYLSQDDVRELGEDLRQVPQFQAWIVDYYSPNILRFMNRSRMKKRLKNSPFLFNPKDWTMFFAARGWQPREARFLPAESKRLGREIPMTLPLRIFQFLAPKLLEKKHGKFQGYVVLTQAPVATENVRDIQTF